MTFLRFFSQQKFKIFLHIKTFKEMEMVFSFFSFHLHCYQIKNIWSQRIKAVKSIRFESLAFIIAK